MKHGSHMKYGSKTKSVSQSDRQPAVKTAAPKKGGSAKSTPAKGTVSKMPYGKGYSKHMK